MLAGQRKKEKKRKEKKRKEKKGKVKVELPVWCVNNPHRGAGLRAELQVDHQRSWVRVRAAARSSAPLLSGFLHIVFIIKTHAVIRLFFSSPIHVRQLRYSYLMQYVLLLQFYISKAFVSDAAQCCHKPEVFAACPVNTAQDEKITKSMRGRKKRICFICWRLRGTDTQSGCLYCKEIN